MKTDVFIYTLSDPRTGQVRYVGATTQDIRQRFRMHLRGSMWETNPKASWIRLLQSFGLRPILGLVTEVPLEAGEEAERDWIGHFRSLGCDLLNQTSGGQKGWKASSAYISKLKKSWKKRGPVSDEIKARISAGTRGKKRRPRSPEIREKIRNALKGRKRPPFSAEWLANMSKARKGKTYAHN